MRIKPCSLILIVFLIIPSSVFSFTATEEQLIITGNEKLMNFQVPEAKANFEKLIQLKPNHPVGHFYKCYTYFFSAITSSLTKNEKSEFKEVVKLGDYINSRFDPQNEEDKLFKIAMKAVKIFFDFDEGNWASAIFGAYSAYKAIKQLVEEYPGFVDAKIGSGIFNMLISLIPKGLRSVLSFFNITGSIETGIEHLTLVSQKGKYFKNEALAILAFYRTYYLKQYEKAKSDYIILIKKFPRNYHFQVDYIDTFYYEKKFEECIRIMYVFKKNLADTLKVKKDYYIYLFDFTEARIFFEKKDYNKAMVLFESVIKMRQENWRKDYYAVYSLLYKGMIYDITNNREKALNVYYLLKSNLDRDYFTAKQYADMFIKEPFKYNDPRIYKTKKAKGRGLM